MYILELLIHTRACIDSYSVMLMLYTESSPVSDSGHTRVTINRTTVAVLIKCGRRQISVQRSETSKRTAIDWDLDRLAFLLYATAIDCKLPASSFSISRSLKLWFIFISHLLFDCSSLQAPFACC